MSGARESGTMIARLPEMVCMFPGLDPAAGGVQTAAGLAWGGLRARYDGVPDRLAAFEYGPRSRTPRENGQITAAGSRLGALVTVLGRRWPVRVVLVWHLSLLRLLPFLRAGGARVVLVLSGIEAWQPPDWLTRRLLRRVDVFLSISDHTWQRFVELNPELRTAPHRTVHLGLGRPVDRQPPDPTDPPSALMIGRLVRAEDYKGHREVIAAWPRVLERHPTAELWIAGDGDLRPDLERMVGTGGLGARVRFHGRVSESEKEGLLARSRCLVMPSRGEGFGLVYVEAMRMARPCLVGAADAGREVVNPPEAGLAVDPRDRPALAGALCRLLEPGPEWTRWSEAGRRRYEESFTANHFQGRLLAALREAGLFDG